ncbi:hypothetical protein [Thermoanaerobacterium butyriciformans]|uniref:Type III secretory pathway component EscU n=1 Tax=Thermoanaerobacterium butyriciformans TaxID=1702242 RepID=A0ABS4NB18_9THEO|nr:hypothetical protein [Thermoanaerobacterium butyriciformans]MBP2070875.1 type III secretory pathway component EscU [Thermoanaerobacterium butyriciformans]
MEMLSLVSLIALFILLIIFSFVKENMILDFAVLAASSLACVLTVAYFVLSKGGR